MMDTTWSACAPGYLCMTPDDARKEVHNKTSVGRWMSEANNVIDYYERTVTPAKTAPVSPSAHK
jgi:hypothetical protein